MLTDLARKLAAEHPVLHRLGYGRILAEESVRRLRIAGTGLRRISAADAHQRKALRQALGVRVRAHGATIVAMVYEEHGDLDRGKVERRQPRTVLVAIGHRGGKDGALYRVTELCAESRGGDRPPAGPHEKHLGVREALLDIGEDRTDVRQVFRAEPEVVAHSLGKLVGRGIDNHLGEIRIDQVVADPDQEVGRGTELQRHPLAAQRCQIDGTESSHERDDHDLWYCRWRIADEEIGLRDTAAARNGHELLRRVTVRSRGEKQRGEQERSQSTVLRMSARSAARKLLNRAAVAPSITR